MLKYAPAGFFPTCYFHLACKSHKNLGFKKIGKALLNHHLLNQKQCSLPTFLFIFVLQLNKKKKHAAGVL